MISTNYIITSPEGIHARPATALVRLVRQFKSAVSIRKGEKAVLLNSMLNILTLAARGGDTVTIVVEGDDELLAAEAIDKFFMEELKQL